MSIEVMKLALEALENASPSAWASRVDSDTMKSIWRKHLEALEGLQVLLAELDNASCKSVQKRLEAKQPATPDLRIGVCITDGVLHATVMQHDSNGAITVVATAEIDAASLHGRDCIGRMKPATGEQEADGLPPIVAGAVFDFAGFMTTRSEVIEVGSVAAAGPVAELVKEWAELRGLDLANAAVLSWQLHITRASLPATPEPVVSRNPFASRCYTMSESHLSGHRLIVGFEKLGDAQDAHEWVARQGRGDFPRPAPSVPEGYALVPIEPTQAMLNVQTWDFSSFYSPREIWAAMLAAK